MSDYELDRRAERIPAIADFYTVFFNELKKKGFTREEAIELIKNTNFK